LRFELVRDRLGALPRELPAAPAILTPVRLDSPEAPFPTEEQPRGRPAAVLVLLFPDTEGQARVLLTTRVPHGIQHAGEVSFPGGSAEEDDTDPIATALREAAEEVGLDPTACGLSVTGVLEVFALTVSGYRITPVLALADRRPEFRPNPREVGRIVEAPVEAFLPDAPVELEERVIRERLVRYGAYPVAGERVWGATARMLGQLGSLLAVDRAPVTAEATLGRGRAASVPPAAAEDLPLIRAAGPERDGHRGLPPRACPGARPRPSALVRATYRGRVRPDCGHSGLGSVGQGSRTGRPQGLRGADVQPGRGRDRGNPSRCRAAAARPGVRQASRRRRRGCGRGGRQRSPTRLDARRL